MKQFMDITPDKIYEKPLEEFTFRMEADKIVFTVEKGYFAGFGEYYELEMSNYRELGSDEYPRESFFLNRDDWRVISVYDEGHFNYTYVEGPLTKTMIARCGKY